MTVSPPGRHWRALAWAGLAAILAATLYPIPAATSIVSRTPLLCLVCGENGGTDVILNLLLFMPFAIGLRLSGWSWGRVTVACATLSLGVELCQYLGIPGRDASLSDVLTNTTGGSVAAAAAPLLRVALAPGRRDARRLVHVGVTAWIAFAMLTAWLFSPWTRAGTALSERSNRSPRQYAYRGELRRVVVSGERMPDGWLDARASQRVADLFARDSLDVRLDLVSQPASESREWIYRLRIGAGLLAVNQQGTALVLELPRRLALLQVFNPTLRLDRGAPDSAGVPFSVAAGERGPHAWLQSTVHGRTRRIELLLAPTMAWGALVPFNYAFGPEARFLTMIWVAVLTAPLGFWSAHTGRPATALAILATAIAAGLGLIPWLSQTGPVPWRDWLGAVAGVAAGWAARAPAAYLASRCGSPSASESSSS